MQDNVNVQSSKESQSEQLSNQNTKSPIRMLQEEAKISLLRDGKFLIMKDFTYRDIGWEYLDSHESLFIDTNPKNVQRKLPVST